MDTFFKYIYNDSIIISIIDINYINNTFNKKKKLDDNFLDYYNSFLACISLLSIDLKNKDDEITLYLNSDGIIKRISSISNKNNNIINIITNFDINSDENLYIKNGYIEYNEVINNSSYKSIFDLNNNDLLISLNDFISKSIQKDAFFIKIQYKNSFYIIKIENISGSDKRQYNLLYDYSLKNNFNLFENNSLFDNIIYVYLDNNGIEKNCFVLTNKCTCSKHKTISYIKSLDISELNNLKDSFIDSSSKLEIKCSKCGKTYYLSRSDLV